MRITFFILLLGATFSFLSAQQSREISGKVLDASDHSPLPGATVIVKGTNNGAVTDVEGSFTYIIESADLENTVIEVSYIGYKTQSVKLNESSYFEFKLEEDISSLEEVVVTSSYGTKKLKQEVVGSISNIKTQDLIIEQNVASFDALLEGQAAGVYIEGSSEIGAPVEIHIRGQGSLSALNGNQVGTSTQPLIIVDGVILSEEVGIDGSAFFDGGSNLYSEDYMNPLAKIGITDIESINILKDAAAVSLYGADGANGVIVITTKKGKKGKLKTNFQAQGGISSAMNQMIYMNGEQYQELRNIYYLNSGQSSLLQQWNGVDTDWYDLLNRTGVSQRYNLSFSGGGEKVSFRTGLGYQHIEEPQLNNNFTKYNTNISLDYQKGKFQMGVKVAPAFTVKNAPNTLFNFAVPPTIAPYDDEGNYTKFDFYGNPLAVANQNQARTEILSFLNSINAAYSFNDNLVISTTYGMDFSFKDQDTYLSGLNETGIDNQGNLGNRLIRKRNNRRWNWNGRISYNKEIKEHAVDVLAGFEVRSEYVYASFEKGKGFPDPGEIMPIEMAAVIDRHDDSSENRGRSLFSQVNYNYKKKYFLLANFRLDQSSVFGSDNNTSMNGGLGASWVLNKEAFLQDVKFVEFLRLRVSYGTSGNSRIGSYRAKGLYSVFEDTSGGYNGGQYAYPSSPPNPNLSWERNYKFNAGLDFTTRYRVSLSIEFFNDNIQDMIVSRDILPEQGLLNVQINGANMYNRGWEFALNGDIISTAAFKWRSQFNISFVTNKVTYLAGLGSDYSTAARATAQKVGYSTSIIWGYEFAGIDPATGRELFWMNGELIDGEYLKTWYNTKTDWEPIGNTQPDFYGGFNNKFSLGKHISLSINMSYSYGADRLIQKELIDHYPVISNRNLSVNTYYDSWRQPGDIALYPAPSRYVPFVSNSTKYIYNMSRIKLNSVILSYNMPVKRKDFFLKSLRIFVNGSNLYYWYLDKGEEGKNGIAEISKVYPEMRTVSLGLNANF